jgi:hypothetical protein
MVRKVSIARLAAVTSSVAMTVKSSTSPRGVCRLSETTGCGAGAVGGSPGK